MLRRQSQDNLPEFQESEVYIDPVSKIGGRGWRRGSGRVGRGRGSRVGKVGEGGRAGEVEGRT